MPNIINIEPETWKLIDQMLRQNVMKFMKETSEACQPMPNEKQIELYNSFKKKYSKFVKQEMKELKKYLYKDKEDSKEINSSTLYHATNNIDNAKAIIDNGFDIWRLNDKKIYENSGRVGNYVKELGPGVYLSPVKPFGYGDVILKANANVKNTLSALRGHWLFGLNSFLNKLEKLAYTDGYTIQERGVIGNRFIYDLMQSNKIDAVYLHDNTWSHLDQIVIFDPKNVKFSL